MKFNRYEPAAFEREPGLGRPLISPFIKVAVIANACVFLAQYFVPAITPLFGFTPERFLSAFPNYIFQPLTYMFLHGGIAHIFFNMLSLWMFGTEIEYQLGTRRFVVFYLLSGLSGALLTLAIQPGMAIPVVGASAAIYGVLIAYWLSFPERYVHIYFIFPVKVKWAIPGLMIIGFLFTGPGVAHFAHLGGALFGLAYMKTDWQFASWTRRLKSLRSSQQERKLEKNRERAEDVMRRVDAILDRINEVGIENLTREERRFLDEASATLGKRKKEQ